MNYHIIKPYDSSPHSQAPSDTECWCKPDIEEYDGCTVVLHRRGDVEEPPVLIYEPK